MRSTTSGSRPPLRRASPIAVSSTLVLLASTLAAQTPPDPIDPTPIDPAPNAKFRTWFYGPGGNLVWDRHQFYEDNANTVFSLAHDFVAGLAGQSGSYPDVLLLNYAQFEPPEGDPAATRHLALESIRKKGLQLWVNYSDALVDPAAGVSHFRPGSFFISIGSPANTQTEPAVPEVGFIGHTISATRAALGYVQLPQSVDPEPHETNPQPDPQPIFTPPPTPNAIYVTASIGYGKNDIDPLDHALVDEAWSDILLLLDPATGYWVDHSQRVPGSARVGNSSGVAFADFNGDGYHDLYVGKCGDNWAGEKNVLCIYKPSLGTFADETATRIPGEYPGATNDVAAGDLDADGDLDIVVANRMKRGGPAGPESLDYVLLNNGTGHFSIVMLDPANSSDTRSVALGDIDHVTGADAGLEIVLGNAGNDGLSTVLEFPASENHTMEIFRDVQPGAGLTYGNRTLTEFMTADGELESTTPRTLQVLLRDVARPAPPGVSPWAGDGWPELVVVNHRETLKNEITISSGVAGIPSHVVVLMNRAAPLGPGDRWFAHATAFATLWGQTVALADFVKDGAGGALDFFVGCGNRFSGAHCSVQWNRGAQTPAGEAPWGDLNGSYDLWPGTEHSYGFDFADWNGNGIMDAVQTARTYDYIVKDFDEVGGHLHPHFEVAGPQGTQQTSNRRGRLNPAGMEDGCFADFDRDGDMDLLMASQRGSSSSMPPGYAPEERESAETIVVENRQGALAHDASFETLADGLTQVLLDDKIDLVNRNASRYPQIADRVVCGDLDNDGDVDALVHLFGLVEPYNPPAVGPDFLAKIEAPEFPEFPNAPGRHSLGWRYLKNVIGDAGTPAGQWFKDVAGRAMKMPSGGFSRTWNRGLGSDVLGDFDNNGALDLYTTSGRALFAANGPHGAAEPPENHQVEDIAQTDDLLFMNGIGFPIGDLVEMSATLLPPRALDEIGSRPKDSAGSFGVTQGDVDNDGDADVVVMHFDGERTTLPWLLINKLNVAGVGKFEDEFEQRMDWSTLSPLIHTTVAMSSTAPPAPLYPSAAHPGVYCDEGEFCALLDWDGDGDLDLVYAVNGDLPRFWRNKGADTNADGVIDVLDGPARGTFEDVTSSILLHHKVSLAANDMAVVDIEGDGDLDFAVDPFLDAPTIWRNEQVLGIRPRVAEIWPRVGTMRGGLITLHGANLTGLNRVELRFVVNGAVQTTVITSGITVLSDTRATVQIPSSASLTNWGLAQVRVRRQAGSNSWWSRQYSGYFILK